MDWLACVAGGRGSEAHRVAAAAGLDPVRRAALLGNWLEMDDVHRAALLHPGPVIWPAALLAEPKDMDALLDGAVRGYEAMIVVGAMLDAHHYARWHPTATAGTIGAAAAAASIAELDRERICWALGNAGSVTGGLWHMRHADVLTKQMHVLHAATTGAFMAEMAGHALTGPSALLEGAQGLFFAMCEAPRPLELGDGWRIDEVSFKPWAACRHAHPAIDCALELRAAGRLAPPFHVETYKDAITFCDRPDPQTPAQAKFSLQHAIAVVANGRNAEPADFTTEAIAALAPLRDKVSVSEDRAFTGSYPTHFGARVNGFMLRDTLGDPERPLEQEGMIEKLRMLAAWGGLEGGAADTARTACFGDDPGAVRALLEAWL